MTKPLPIRETFISEFQDQFEPESTPHITFEASYDKAYIYSGVVHLGEVKRYYMFKTEKPLTLVEAKLAARRVVRKMVYHFGGAKKEKPVDFVTAKLAAGGIDGKEEQL